MGPGAWAMVVVFVLGLGSLAFVVWSMVRSIVDQRTGRRPVWQEFSLGICLLVLFLVTWLAHGLVDWQVYTDEQRAHHEPVTAGDFVAEFGSSTLENWQSEFLQLFAFVSLAALFRHRGSAESKDGDEKLEAALRRIEERLGTLPPDAPSEPGKAWQLPDAPD